MGTRRNPGLPGNNQLLHSKLLPPRLPSNLIRREELLARLDSCLTRKIGVVAAPTGFGKTTLVRMWLASRELSSAWVTLDENDNDPVRFWTYCCSALRTVNPSVGKATLSLLMAPQPPSFESLLTPLINDLAGLKKPCVLVLEDYNVIRSAEVHKGLSLLVQHLPESPHLILVTRSDPDLPLAILRARDELIELNAADLRFNEEEAESFLQSALKAHLPSPLLSGLLQKTEGWPAGLRLVVRSLQDKSDPAAVEKLIRSFSGSDRYVADYLIPEVFEIQPEAIQDFLLKTCFFRRITGSLCDALTGTNQSTTTLEHLERENLFIVQLERRGDQTWYRYNSLFAESLQYLARQRLDEGDIRALFERASQWYEYHGLLDEAIETTLAAQRFDRALALIEKFIEIHDVSEMRTISRWLLTRRNR